MKKSIEIGYVDRPLILLRLGRIRKVCNKWLNTKSETFSMLGDEDFTHREVIYTHLGFLAFVLACILAS